jgi:acyl-CoA thioester hydrolase
MPSSAPSLRADYRFYSTIQTRWFDNDVYGHVNNTVYYSYFDTVIAHLLMHEGGLDPRQSEIIGYAVETGCRFHRPISFPDLVHAGLRVGRMGKSSVRYEIALFCNDEKNASAEGHFVHVFVDRTSQRPASIPDGIRSVLERVQIF